MNEKLRIIIATDKEEFVDLVYDNIRPIYEISNYGTVRNKFTKHELKQEDNSAGYLRVPLMLNNGKSKKFSVHKLVAIMWVENPDPETKTFVNHITEGKEYRHFNYYENLEWCTPSENQLHYQQFGLFGDTSKNKGNTTNHYRGEERYNAIASEELIREIRAKMDIMTTKELKKSLETPHNLTDTQLNSLIHHQRKGNSWKSLK